jgi:ribosomal protein L11 methyltransferase
MKKTTFYLLLDIPSDSYETALGKCIEFDMMGCEEQETPEGIQIRAYFKDEETARKASRELKEKNPAIKSDLEAVEDRDWNAKWRENMSPARLAAGWYVSPVWLPPPRSAKHWIKIEPKMAFGTGHHETTRLAAQAVIAQKRHIKGRRVLDIGTGSGVLCFVAGLCGAKSCAGVEIDVDCLGNCAENLRSNASHAITGFAIGSINCLKGRNLFDLIVMNMLLTESAPLLPAAASLLAPAGTLVWSGILTDEHREAVKQAASSGLALDSEKRENEWWCGTFRTDK